MKSVFKPVLIAGLMATLGLVAFAQTPGQGSPMQHGDMMGKGGPSQHEGMGKMDPAKMQERMADMKHPDRAEMDKLTTPERIDKMRALRTQRDAEMDKRADATKAFYATLTPEQKKVFDANTARSHHGRERKGPGAEGHRH